ncbi:MAG: phage tail sheath subtilisin-like domain-containing protein [Candidatus Brocadia sp.]|nr:phage tail sheath subtilisin-like domain-containing protein [Candidatus Brocadia sp.]
MPSLYKTPGVYVEEIPKFPPSIAPVETAIPAFIGYTEEAIRNGESLVNKPTRIESIAEFEFLFGGAPSQDVNLFLDTNNQFIRADAAAKLYLYDSLRMFYANGGGKCYILSVGPYPNNVSSAMLEAAITLLEQEDEPTIIIAPDAVSDTNGPYEFQKKALAQCNKLMDRVTICDLKKTIDNTAFNSSVAEFREKVGINFLKYGAAYGPWLRANLPRTLMRRNVILKRDGSGAPIQLNSLTTDPDIQSLIAELINVESFVGAAVTAKNTLTGTSGKTLEDALKVLLDTYNATTSTATATQIETALKPVATYMINIIKAIKSRYDASPVVANSRFKLRDDIDKYLNGQQNPLKVSLRNVADHHKFLSGLTPPTNVVNLLTTGADLDTVAAFLGFTDGTTLLTPPVPPAVTGAYASAATAKQRGDIAIGVALSGVKEAIAFFNFLESTQNNYEKTLNDALLEAFGTYKELVTKAAEALNLLPPSGAIAGVYASVDRDRGVWKAPANVSLNSVIGPAVKITHEQQAEFNVDVNAGKSINIIRAFTGKGSLVWGARTLAGNDNEWRYINVRRFFNFVEESSKKATEQFVFEPNDANTWVRVQGMIENFLTFLWRQGAMQGIKPEHAFYVAVGLGKTMTPLDILEGRMIVEIGMAVVRPAEFIILRFSHKMAES